MNCTFLLLLIALWFCVFGWGFIDIWRDYMVYHRRIQSTVDQEDAQRGGL